LHQTSERHLSNVSLQSLIDSVTRSLNLCVKAKHLTLSTTLAGAMLRVDKEQMEVVFNNLINNAIRFSPDGGTIEVHAQRLEHEIRIRICDQGPGVPPEDRAYIFQPFYQGNNQPPGLIRGSGLGLAIAQAHVEAHGGELRLSDEQNVGTCFDMRLPIDKETLSDAC
jgi:two-component system sensor histidine kinase GlrK